MVKRIFPALIFAATLVGCGGNGGAGTSNFYGVNAEPNVGSATISVNSTPILNTAAYATSSSGFTAAPGGANSQILVSYSATTNSSSGSSNFNSGAYYALYAYGNGTTVSNIGVYPIDVSAPAANQGRLIFTNSSVTISSVDVYVTQTTTTSTSGLQPTVASLTAFNSGFPVGDIDIPAGTYNVFFNQAGTQNTVASSQGLVVGTTATGAGANQIQSVGITDVNSVALPITQQMLPTIVYQVVNGQAPPVFGTKPFVILGKKKL